MARRDMARTIAIKAAEDAHKAWTFHVKQCAACSRAIKDERLKALCDEGWPLASRESSTRVALDNLREARRNPPTDNQLVMF